MERLCAGIASVQASWGDEDESAVLHAKLEDWIRQWAGQPDSQVARFLDFLEDEALSRVRLAVGFGIMRAVAAAVRERSGKDAAAQPSSPTSAAWMPWSISTCRRRCGEPELRPDSGLRH